MDRRNFVKPITSFGLSLTSGKLFAAGVNQPRLLVVFLRVGYDPASLPVPTSSDFYYESRPYIAIAKPSSDVGTALPLNADWGGMHVSQGDSSGYLANQFNELGNGLAAFSEEIGPTFRQNGGRGTDHGHGTILGARRQRLWKESSRRADEN